MSPPEFSRRPLAPTSINAILNSPQRTNPRKPIILPAPIPMLITHSSASNIHTIHFPSAPPQGPKRKAHDIEDKDTEDDRLYQVDQSCDQIRRKIRTFLSTGEMGTGEFQKAIGVNSKGYSIFMRESGAYKGQGSNTYIGAFKFFKKRELQGIKPAKKKRISKAEESAKNDVSGIHLIGEVDITVPVYDSCDEIRRKIQAHLVEDGVTQAGFLREIAKTYPDGRKIQSKVLNDFLGKDGPSAGNTSAVFYSSYVYFEKMRLRDGKPKSGHRLEMEKIHAGGFDI